MKFAQPSRLASLLFVVPLIAQAHPGHDGHELTWDFAGTHVHLEWILAAMLTVGALVFAYRFAKKRNFL